MTADKNRDRWNNSPKGPPPRKTFGGAGGGDFEHDRAYSEETTADDKAEDADAPETETSTTTADEVTGPDAGDERYGAARDRERQRTGNIGPQKPDGTT